MLHGHSFFALAREVQEQPALYKLTLSVIGA